MNLKCLFKGHDWVVGRVAEKWARQALEHQKSYHNRVCRRCHKEEWNADDVERKAKAVLGARDIILGTKNLLEKGRHVAVDPDEFP